MTDRQSTLAHEAAHVVGGLLAGHRVKGVTLGATKRNPTNTATTSFDFSTSSEFDAFAHLVAVLMGPMAEGKPPPRWPPLPDLEGYDDEHVAARLVAHLRLTEADYRAAVAIAAHWLDDPLVKSAMATVAHLLGQEGVLTDDQIRKALGPQMLAWFARAAPEHHGELAS